MLLVTALRNLIFNVFIRCLKKNMLFVNGAVKTAKMYFHVIRLLSLLLFSTLKGATTAAQFPTPWFTAKSGSGHCRGQAEGLSRNVERREKKKMTKLPFALATRCLHLKYSFNVASVCSATTGQLAAPVSPPPPCLFSTTRRLQQVAVG